MPKEDWKRNPLDSILKQWYPHGKVRSILDVGCGLSLKSQYLDAVYRVGIDVYRPYLRAIQSSVDYVAVVMDVSELTDRFLPHSFDLVIATDILEHLPKPDGYKLIEDCEYLAKQAVILETPLGYVPQNIDIWGLGGDIYQTHRSAWNLHEFSNLNYHCVVRDYKMSDVKRHTSKEVENSIQLIDAIKLI